MKTTIGVVGLGLMGCSISCCLLCAGHQVTGIEKDQHQIGIAIKRIAGFLDQLAAQGLLKQDKDILMQRLLVSEDLSALKGHELVLESIGENLEQKKEVFKEIERIVSPSCIIGSNTSSIPISVLQEHMSYPQRLIGVHWGEPAHISRFMEVIVGDQSDLVCANVVLTLASSCWGKEPVLVQKDIKGFVANRLMYALLREAFSLVENGDASVEDVDRACRNDMGLWMAFAGPFRYMDLTGIEAYANVMEGLFPALSTDTKVPELIKEKLSIGATGVAKHSGFYSYTHASANQWEQLHLAFSSAINLLTDEYRDKIDGQ